jgi:hypothetical protein
VPFKARDVSSVLKQKGFEEYPDRDHTFYFFHYSGKKTSVYTKISHGETDIGDPLCSLMARQMKLTKSQFRDFIDCPLTVEEYTKVLEDHNHVKRPVEHKIGDRVKVKVSNGSTEEAEIVDIKKTANGIRLYLSVGRKRTPMTVTPEQILI